MIMKHIIILKKTNKFLTLETPSLGGTTKLVSLYKIDKGTQIPKEALDPEIWDIPEGYYAIEETE